MFSLLEKVHPYTCIVHVYIILVYKNHVLDVFYLINLRLLWYLLTLWYEPPFHTCTTQRAQQTVHSSSFLACTCKILKCILNIWAYSVLFWYLAPIVLQNIAILALELANRIIYGCFAKMVQWLVKSVRLCYWWC